MHKWQEIILRRALLLDTCYKNKANVGNKIHFVQSVYLFLPSQHSQLGQENTLTASMMGRMTPTHNQRPGYDTKPSYGEALVLEFWGMWSTPSLPVTPCSLWPEKEIPVKIPSIGQIELFNHLL